MKTLLKNAKVVNVFSCELEKVNVLIQGDTIIGVGDYLDTEADFVVDLQDKIIAPSFIDGHIHIESTMLTPVTDSIPPKKALELTSHTKYSPCFFPNKISIPQ